ncbi:MAG: exopolysaccharide biosynthesis protein [Alphaproteobacteria bacterium]|nr:exopolysaccharide biosynthesis protein [Alphaproteobacteria bacterium]
MSAGSSDETIVAVLKRLTDPAGGARLSLDEAIEVLGDRGYGLAMLLLSLPMALPISAIPGISTVFGIPLILIAAQLMLGRHRPWLPRWLGAKSFERAELARVLDMALPWLDRAEKLVRPRLGLLVTFAAERAIGTLCVLMAALMAMPIVLGNQPPAIAISLFALALIGRDGLFVILGLAVAIVSVLLVAAVLGAFAAGIWLAIREIFG